MRIINLNLFPAGGFFFRDADGSVHRAGSWRRVIAKVTEYRARNKMPPGKPEEEVFAQACVRQPAICGGNQTQAISVVKPATPFKAKVLQWCNSLRREQEKGPLVYVSDAESKRRAAICATCPFNTPTGANDCSSCKQSFVNYRDNLIGTARPRDKRLGGCKILNSDLVTAVHLDEVRIDNSALPGHCWRKIGA